MKEDLILALLSASTIDELERLVAEDPFLSDPKRWQIVNDLIIEQNAIESLALAIHDAINSVIRQRCRSLGITDATVDLEPSIIREKLYQDAQNWNTYKSIRPSARAVMLSADGQKFLTNLILSDEGILGNRPIQIPPTLTFCGPRSWVCYAYKDDLGYWQIVLYRITPNDNAISCCVLATSTKTVLPFHPEATRAQKLFQYSLPIGGRSVITKDVLDQIQQTIHDSTIPFVFSDQAIRYNYDRFLTKASLGLDFKLRRSQQKKMAYMFSGTWNGKIISIYLFKLRTDGEHEQTVKNNLTKLYFRTDRHVVFLRQGIVIGQLGADFVEYSIGFKHLRNYLLVSLDNISISEIEGLKISLAAYLAGNVELKKWNSIYNEELTFN